MFPVTVNKLWFMTQILTLNFRLNNVTMVCVNSFILFYFILYGFHSDHSHSPLMKLEPDSSFVKSEPISPLVTSESSEVKLEPGEIGFCSQKREDVGMFVLLLCFDFAFHFAFQNTTLCCQILRMNVN